MQVAVEELGVDAKALEGDDGDDNRWTAALRAKLGETREENLALGAALLRTQRDLDAARKEASYLSSASRQGDDGNLGTALIDPGLARQFRHMESEVEQGREVMKEMQDELVAVTYTPDAVEFKRQVERLHALERENENLKRQAQVATASALKGQTEVLKKQVKEAQAQYRTLQEYTKQLDQELQAALSKKQK